MALIAFLRAFLRPRSWFSRREGDWRVSLLSRSPRLKALAERRARRLSDSMLKAGVVGNPFAASARALATAVIAAPPAVASAVLLALLVWPPLAAVAALPAAVYFAPELRLRDMVSERREKVERELPFFSMLVNVLGSAGVPLYDVFKGVIESGGFPGIRSEAQLIRREVSVFGSDPNEAFERVAVSHPSGKFSSFLLGYASKVRSGGDMPAYLSGESGLLMRELEEGWTRYADRAGMVGSTMVTVFGLIPLLLMVVAVFSPATSVTGLVLFTAVGVPVFTLLLVYMAGRMQPVGEEPLAGDWKRSLAASAPALALALFFGASWIPLAGFLLAFLTAYGLSVRRQMTTMQEVDRALPSFMKDVLEYKRQEYDLTRALLSISAHNRYTPSFDRVLAAAAVQLRAGTPLDELVLDSKTRLARMTFFVLGEMSRSGGGSVDTVFQLSEYTSKVVEMKGNTKAEMRPYLLLSYASPVLLAFGVTFVGGMLRSFGTRAGPGVSSLRLAGMGFGGSSPALSQVSSLLIVASAAALGIIGAKMVDFTVKNTLRASVNVLVAAASTVVLTSVGLTGLLHLVG